MKLLLSLTGVFGLSLAQHAPVVTVKNGTIQGATCPSTTVDFYGSIPFAQAPIGDLRFAAPQPYDQKYNGTLNGTQQPPSCIQFGSAFIGSGPQSEDCLFLNVWTPGNATSSSKLPVKVWIHGGGDEGGGVNNPLYDGCYTATDSLLVAVNYRLGPLGGLSLTTLGLGGNYHIQDLLLALEWIQENIAAFGGDPTKVVMFGQSAGAFNTFALASLPQAPSLMRAAIMSSGGGIDFATTAEAEKYDEQFVSKLNCGVSDLGCLRSISPTVLNATVNIIEDPTNIDPTVLDMFYANGKGLAWGPIVDGKIIPAQPSQAGVKVPSIFGSTSQDGTLFVLASYKENIDSITEAQYDAFLSYAFGPLASTVNKTYSFSSYKARSPIPGFPPLPGFFAMSDIITDTSFRCPAYRGSMTAAANGVPVWTYEFSHPPSCQWATSVPDSPEVLALIGAAHTSELPFVFGVVDDLPRPSGNCSLNSAEREMSSFIRNAWTSLAATGSPGADWPEFTANGSRGMNFGDSPQAGVVDYTTCQFWDQINAQISKLDASTTSNSNTTSTGSGTGPATSSGKTVPSLATALVAGNMITINVLIISSLVVYYGIN